ncbi:DMT family transporter [Agrobacterium sp. LMR679]|uniref:DMT family transporter n=1 Tax=Agrobacterium sp. LMR679 TaxID=3014335 RepID=UPI0022B03D7A|nr:DMT family transporter [Agrobacterium sp. LMR679]MCZ4072088.1 DMT family transporter [Agrobacterium sp. LMR679]
MTQLSPPGATARRARNASSIGIAAAIFATFSWSLNFLSPYVLQGYTSFDFVTVRFIFCGVIGGVIVYLNRKRLKGVSVWNVVLAGILGLIGYSGYVYCVMGGVIFAGPVIPPAILGAVPFGVAVLGNITQKKISWSKLYLPLVLISLGLGITNIVPLVSAPSEEGDDIIVGIFFSFAAVFLWIVFSLLNQKALSNADDIDPRLWTGLMMFGAGVGMMTIFPFGMIAGWSNFPELGFLGWHAVWLFIWAFGLAGFSSVAGAWAWNVASQRLPLAITGQLISVETVFAIILGLILHSELPSWDQAVGVLLLIAGSIVAVRISNPEYS